MHIQNPDTDTLCNELDLIAEHLPLQGATLLELGCGKAQLTRAIAGRFAINKLIATEVDTLQHAINLASDHPANIEFRPDGAQAIGLPDNSIDGIFMFKSLHHVPVGLMPMALQEIARVLKPGGFAWFAEPVYAGAFNDVLRLFHDEKQVREAAFQAIYSAVERGSLTLKQQIFCKTATHFRDFAEFEQRIIGVTHTRHVLDANRYQQVQMAFNTHVNAEGAYFENPQRIDWLLKPL